MSTDKPERPERNHELDGVTPEESEELAAVAERLRAERFEPSSNHFWGALHQRIMNEVAVTPVAGRGARPARRGWVARLAQALPGGRALALGLATLAVVVAVVWMAVPGFRTGHGPVEPLAVPEGIVEGARGTQAAVDVPDELWQEGFLSHPEVALLDADREVWTALLESDDLAMDGADAPFLDDHLEWTETAWGLEGLTADEWVALESMLDG